MASVNNSKVILALDEANRSKALSYVRLLSSDLAMVKVGLETFVAFGPDFVREIRDMGVPVFLDLKLHDIPVTVAKAVEQAVRLDVSLLTVHASGGQEMLRAAQEASQGSTRVIAVTVLTSFHAQALSEVGFEGSVEEQVWRVGSLAMASGVQGLVCSAHELRALSGLGGVRVVPGVRPVGAASHDQKRVATPAQAVADGATWIVVGRPVLQASNPLQALRDINQSVLEGVA
jgi:orotidine-5'-phosphate decarboxylase